MNTAKLTRMESALNGIARKVLDAVPVQTPWTKDQIMGEMRRLGYGAERNVVEGCLDTLRGRGLIREPTRGVFLRVISKPSTTEPEDDYLTQQPTPARPAGSAAAAPVPAANDFITRLADLAKTLRTAADQAEAIALDVEDRVQTIEKDTDKLRQLQALLKSIGQ